MLICIVLYSVLLTCIQSQTIVWPGSKTAEECRRIASDAKHNRCRLKSSETTMSQFSLKDSVPPEWEWVLDHRGTVSGQVIVSDSNSVHLISQKQCVDSSKYSGRPARRLYYRSDSDGNLTSEIAWSADFSYGAQRHGTVYADCTRNPINWNELSVDDESRTMKTSNGSQFVIFRGLLNAFNFNYTNEDIQEAFDEELKKIDVNEGHGSFFYENFPQKNKPMILHRYQGRSGLSILATVNNISREEHLKSNLWDLLSDDPAFRAWSRTTQAKSELAHETNSHLNDDKPPKLLEFILFFLQLFVAVGFPFQAYKSAMSIRPLENKVFSHNETSWKVIRDPADLRFQRDAYKMSYNLMYEFGGALAALIFVFKTLHDSSWWRRTRLLVTQGGLITYGEQREIGSIFYVSHWFHVEVLKQGNKAINRTVWAVVMFLTCGLICSVYLFSISRQVKLHLPVIQRAVRIVYYPIDIGLTVLARTLPDHWSIVKSYEMLFKNTCGRLCKVYLKSPTPCEYTSKLLGRIELEVHRENHGNIFKRIWYGALAYTVTRNDIERASEILAANAHGRLSYFQALTIMFDLHLTETVERFNRDPNCYLSIQEIKHLAMVSYVDGLFMPCNSGNGFTLKSFRRITISDGVHQKTQNIIALAPIIQGDRIREYAIVQPSGERINSS